ncbi:hypothetical protein ABZ172_03395 [Streptomyces sp. NPDC006296]|uniref:hypothetical protein n=1 Tax=Streptomyces sp. NPDC006296 TaxID=3156746 RepID=UPI0033B15BE2
MALLVLAVTVGQLLSAGLPLLMAVLAVGTGLAARFDIYEKAPSLPGTRRPPTSSTRCGTDSRRWPSAVAATSPSPARPP